MAEVLREVLPQIEASTILSDLGLERDVTDLSGGQRE